MAGGKDARTGRANGPGVVARVVGIVTLAVAVLAIFGATYSNGRSVADTQARLDRNCRVLVSIQADIRFVIVQHAARGKHSDEAQAFREIFRRAGFEACG